MRKGRCPFLTYSPPPPPPPRASGGFFVFFFAAAGTGEAVALTDRGRHFGRFEVPGGKNF